jgi:hypothetical protein
MINAATSAAGEAQCFALAQNMVASSGPDDDSWSARRKR